MSACACGGTDGHAMLRREDVPVQQNVLLATRDEARDVPRGTIELVRCGSCGLVRNVAFDPALVRYDPRYDGAQETSPAFVAHLDRLIDEMIAQGVRGRRVAEIGCGRGFFLERLCARGDNRGVGFDGAYVGPPVSADGRTHFVRTFDADVSAADIVVCRHVIEHVPAPSQFLARALAGFRGDAVYIETPAWEWIVENGVFWDVFYEHCNYFSSIALANTLSSAGLLADGPGVTRVLAGQYLFARASRAGESRVAHLGADTSKLLAADEALVRLEGDIARFRRALAARAAEGVVLWGAGAKGVTCAHLVDPDADLIAGLVDLNPRKQGRYVPGSGHRVWAPTELTAGSVRHIVVMNPAYQDEIRRTLQDLDVRADVHVDFEGTP